MKARHSGVVVLLALLQVAPASPQDSFKVYGDLIVREGPGAGRLPATYLLTLYDVHREVVSRQTVAPNGRFSFMNISKGEYDLVIESEGVEVARVHWLILEERSTDIRKDITLSLQSLNPNQTPQRPGSVAMADLYSRKPEAAARYDKALQAAVNREYDKGVALLGQILAEDPKDYEAWSKLGLMQALKGSHGEAEKSYLRSLEAKPDYFTALLNLGNLRIVEKNYDGAVESLTKAVGLQPHSAEANYSLGEAYLQAKKGSKAVGYLNEALRLDPTGMADAHLRLAALYNAANLKDRAAAEYEQFLAKKPDHPDKKKFQEYIRQNKKP